MAIDALLRCLGIVEGERALVRNAALLPAIVIVKAAHPSEVVHGFIKVCFVASRTEFCGVVAMKRLEETLLVRLRIQADEVVVQIAHDGIFAGGDVVERWILDDIPAVAHRIFDLFDGVACGAGESGLCRGGMEVLPNG